MINFLSGRACAIFFFLCVFISQAYSQQSNSGKLKGKRVLVFTKNGKGYVHENIPASIAAIQKMGKEFSFSVDTTANSEIFNEGQLKNYDVLIFSNTNNDVFDTDAQKIAFMRYIQAGGSFMGIHSAAGTERKWKWFKLLLGATFLRHPPFQPFTVYVLDRTHATTKNLPGKWDTKDECYFFKEFNPAVKILLFTDISTVKEAEDGKNTKPDVFGNKYPAAWCHEFDGGKAWYTSLGHNKDDYANPVYLAHIIEGLKWLADKNKLNYKKAYATGSTEIDEMKLF